MSNTKFQNYLLNIGFSEREVSESLENSVFTYTLNNKSLPSVKYIFTETYTEIFLYHKIFWNKNEDNVFIAVGNDNTYIINTKEKPDSEKILKPSICVKSFDYGVNSKGYTEIDLEKISKAYVDSSYFFDFVSKTHKKGQEVDKDLLLNLLALRNDLFNEENDKIINLLILRCLFIKYLEDRGIFDNNYLLSILKSRSTSKLIDAFDEIRKINSDVFKFDIFEASDIKISYLDKIARFFETDYRSGQGSLFPYQFDQIPIQLISHVYEAFLKSDTRKGRGIYYTPSFLVDFMLSHTLKRHVEANKRLRVLDPAVGSAAFLVESFRIIQAAYGDSIDFEKKKMILEQQLYGIDVDKDALQIAAFSLYLALLETESPEYIKQEIKVAHPILPSLIGKTLLLGNTITDYAFDGATFDFIVSNPPWGSVPNTNDPSCKLERIAIDNKDGNFPEYKDVADYERSQAFLMRVTRWSHRNTTYAMVVKNSIFLNDNTKDFRRSFLKAYSIEHFFELSHYNKILFKKREIGEINGDKIELGASEPCVVVLFKNVSNTGNELSYTSPRLTEFAEHFNVIHYIDRETTTISQQEFINKDNLWRVLVNSDLEAFDLIENTLLPQASLKIEARAGFQPKKGMASLGEPIWKEMIEPTDFAQFDFKQEKTTLFNWNQDLHRRRNENIFKGPRIIVAVRPLKPDGILFRGIYLEKEYIYKHNILSIKLKDKKVNKYIDNYLPYLGIINSRLISFAFFQLSAQWGKGEGKRETFRNTDIEKLPVKYISSFFEKKLTAIVNNIHNANSNKTAKTFDLFSSIESNDYRKDILLNQLNETVYDLYDLVDYEKEIINEFYQIEVERADSKLSKVTKSDLLNYFYSFKEVFSLILDSSSTLLFSFYISKNIGTVVRLTIDDQCTYHEPRENSELQLLNLVKSNQLHSSDAFKILNEGKVKIYNKSEFYIIKSNYFKDWTKRQAIRDAKEEISQFVAQLASK